MNPLGSSTPYAWCWLVVLACVGTPAQASESDDFRSYLDQARFFIKQEWYGDAAEQLELAVDTDEGELDAEAWFLLAKVRYELCDLQGALQAAEEARAQSADPQQFSQTHDLLVFFRESFGLVQLRTGGTGTLLELSLQSTIFDPDLKNYFNKLVASLADDPVTGNIEIGLPGGTYLINGITVTVTPGGESVVPLTAGGDEARATGVWSLEVGVGAGGWFGHVGPAPQIEASVGTDLGALAVGLVVDAAPQPYVDRAGTNALAPGGVAAGIRVGLSLPGLGALLIRPSLTAKVGTVPAVELSCLSVSDSLVCGAAVDGSELYVYTNALALMGGGELAVLFAPSATGLGGGLKLQADMAVGTLPGTADANLGGNQVPFTVTDRSWTAPGVRVLGVFRIAW